MPAHHEAVKQIATAPVSSITEQVTQPRTVWKCVGVFRVSAYSYAECAGGESCRTATGTAPRAYITVAADPNVIPAGTRIKLEGVGECVVEDTGGAITGKRLDLFVGHDDPMQWGVRYKKVYIKETAE